MELTVVMPCLNEAETVATCVRKAIGFLSASGISGEVLVADNGSTDGSQRLAEEAGARVVPVSDKGYGNALMGGIVAARGKYIIMGDADDSYDFTNLMPFVDRTAPGRRPGHGQPVRRRDSAGRDAAAAPLPRQSGAELHRPAVLPQQDRRLPLRAARLQPGQRAGPEPPGHRDGVRQRDGGQGGPVRPARDRGAHHAGQGRPEQAAAPAHLAGRLAAPAVPAAVQPALAVLPARPGAADRGPGHRRDRGTAPVPGRHGDLRRGHAGRRLGDGGDRLPVRAVLAVHPGLRRLGGLPARRAEGPAAAGEAEPGTRPAARRGHRRWPAWPG